MKALAVVAGLLAAAILCYVTFHGARYARQWFSGDPSLEKQAAALTDISDPKLLNIAAVAGLQIASTWSKTAGRYIALFNAALVALAVALLAVAWLAWRASNRVRADC